MPSSTHPHLILASASPRRAEILRNAGFRFRVLPTSVDESPFRGESPAKHVVRLAREKAVAAARHTAALAVILAADTIVVVGRRILGKPASRRDARRMLLLLSGKTHKVLTGLAVLVVPPEGRRNANSRRWKMHSAVESTRVTFAPLSMREIADYVASGEPMDKAGAYAIQGRGGKFITRIEGCYFNVVGLPLALLYRTLQKAGLGDVRAKKKRRPRNWERRN